MQSYIQIVTLRGQWSPGIVKEGKQQRGTPTSVRYIITNLLVGEGGVLREGIGGKGRVPACSHLALADYIYVSENTHEQLTNCECLKPKRCLQW